MEWLLLLVLVLVVLGSMGGSSDSGNGADQGSEPTATDVASAAAGGAAGAASANGADTNTAAAAGSGAAAAVEYSFHQGMDSGGYDISNQGALANKPEQLKAWCTAEPRCKGFNTNAWMKHTIRPQSEWQRWAADTPANAEKGFYLKL